MEMLSRPKGSVSEGGARTGIIGDDQFSRGKTTLPTRGEERGFAARARDL